MRRWHLAGKAFVASALLAGAFVHTAGALASPIQAQPVPIKGVPIKKPVSDQFAKPTIAISGQNQAIAALNGDMHQQSFVDSRGNQITVESYLDIDLSYYAGVLVSAESTKDAAPVSVFVTGLYAGGVTNNCGSQVAQACYLPTDNSGGGRIVVGYDDPDLVHSLVHEYGHHVDNQLYNLDRLIGCSISNDGSRRWFFERDIEDNILRRTTCDPRASWGDILGELFAEDYGQLNGLSGWDLEGYQYPPTESMLDAMQEDLDEPFVPGDFRPWRGKLKPRQKRRARYYADAPAFIGVRVKGRSVKRVYVKRGRRIYARGRRRILTLLPQGRFTVQVRAKNRRGRFKVTVDIF